ncbi:MAG: hypothetical protein LZT29_02783 [Pantoea stewartii]|uniref:hypothetical protein n=1 Tax=Pantoea stewartii TaxID=66269 RepID=UPI0024BDA162|nr:hypothetical protein [Pantoea stewartii]WHS99754.1 MAG: hypothetical protein LZT29_02783 [Pantoea stewartii]
MIEKIRISLWDIFTFFMTGVFFSFLSALLFFLTNQVPLPNNLFSNLIKIPTTYIIVVMPVIFILLGLLIEPLANFSDRYLGKYIFFWIKTQNKKRMENEKIMENYIKENCLGDLNSKMKNPYTLCKEYVETKQLSTTFMVFLARYGFYRNCCYIVLSAGFLYTFSDLKLKSITVLLVIYLLSALIKKRADEFYSYQATSVYSAFLIDNLNWPAKKTNTTKEEGED